MLATRNLLKGVSGWPGSSAVDASGNIYVTSGNGYWDGVRDFSDTVLKLGPRPMVHFRCWITSHPSTREVLAIRMSGRLARSCSRPLPRVSNCSPSRANKARSTWLTALTSAMIAPA